MKNNLKKRLVSLLLTAAMLIGLMVPAMATNAGGQDSSLRPVNYVEVDNVIVPTVGAVTLNPETEQPYADGDVVRVSIVMDETPTLQAGFSTYNIVSNAAAMEYRAQLERQQMAVATAIEHDVLNDTALNVVWNLTLAANLISAEVEYGKLAAIAAVDGVREVIVEARYEPDQGVETEGDDTQMQSSNVMTGAVEVWANGYTGAGSRIAIIDTGADLNHQSFSSEGLEYSLALNAEKLGIDLEDYLAEIDLLDQAEVEALLPLLNVDVDAASTWRGTKFPFAYNYIDGNYRVSHDYDENGEHGSHVAGIAAANSYIKMDGEFVNAYDTVGVAGVAPDAQLIVMKVFGEGGGAYTSDYMAAIEDAIILGADSVNLSLGSGSAGFSYANTYESIMAALAESDTVVTMSAGNSYSWPDESEPGYLHIQDVSFDISGSPGSYSNALCVASVDSVGYNDDGTLDYDGYYTMSDFSSWGTHGSLELKPEITAPGGDIYSVNGMIGDGKQYEGMSGTSMAAPQMAGMAGVMAQYIRENDLVTKTGLTVRQLSTSLLMSTAIPLKDAYGEYYSVMKQGSGMANLDAAVSAGTFLVMGEDATAYAADGKVKAELGDDPDKTGVYSFSFTLSNMEGTSKFYTLSTDLFTQAIYKTYLDYDTTALAAELVYTVDGETYVPAAAGIACDLNEDGVTDALDARVILNAVLDGTTLTLPVAADVNTDGKVDTYDAHLILAGLVTEAIEVPANGKVEITVTATLTAEQKAELDAGYPNGAWVEGYVYANAADEGDVTHSIPVLAFYGSWTDPSMFGQSYIDAYYNGEREPYFGSVENNDLVITDSATGESYLVTGNPYMKEESFPADRVAVSSTDLLSQFRLSLIRNAAAMRLQIVDQNGNQLYTSGVATYVNGAYYYVNGGEWRNTSNNYTLNVTPADIGAQAGDTITVEVTAIPEYYALRKTLTEQSMNDIIASGVLGDGATLSVTLNVDDEAPVITGIKLDEETNELVVECSDDNYVAAILLMDPGATNTLASGLPEQTAANETITYRLPLSGVSGSGEFLLVVGDYAANQATLKLELELGEGGGSEGGEGGETPEVPADASVYIMNLSSNNWITVTYDGSSPAFGSSAGNNGFAVVAAEYVDGYLVTVGADGCLYIANQSNPKNANLIRDLNGVVTVCDLAFNMADKQLYMLTEGNVIYTVDVYTGELTQKYAVSIVPTNTAETCYKLQGMAIDGNGRFYLSSHGGTGYEFASNLYTFVAADAVDGVVAGLERMKSLTRTVYSWSDKVYESFSSPYIGGYSDNGFTMTYDHANDCVYAYQYGRSNISKLFYFELTEKDGMTYINGNVGLKSLSVSYNDDPYNALYSLNASAGIIQSSTEATSLTLSSTEVKLAAGGTARLTYSIGPWNLANTAVTWSSSDENVATVNNGLVTAVGKGTATITVTSVATPSLTATCTVTVQEPDPIPESVKFQGLVYGADSQTYWSEFTTDNTENWTVVEGPSSYYYGGVLVDNVIYAHDGGYVYAVDPDTFEGVAVTGISSDWYWNDAAPAPGYGESGAGAVLSISNNGTLFCVVDPVAGSVSYEDLGAVFSADPMANIALYATGEANGLPAYYCYVLTETGNLYDFVVTAADGDEEVEYTFEYNLVSSTGLKQPGVSEVVGGASSSMIYDEESGYLFLASYVEGDYAYLYSIWPATGTTTRLGHFGSGVWPVNSLYVYDTIDELTLRVSETEVSMYEGDEYELNVRVLPREVSSDVIITSGNTSVVKVVDGKLVAVDPGTATVTVTTVATDELGARSATVVVTVLPVLDVDLSFNAMVEVDGARYYWANLNTGDLTSFTVIQEYLQRIISGGAHNGYIFADDGAVSYFWGFIPVGYPLMIDPNNGFDAVAGEIMDLSYMPTDVATLPKINATYDLDGVETDLGAGDIPLQLSAAGALLLMDFEGGSASGWTLEPEEYGGNMGGLAYDGNVKFVDEDGVEHDAHSYYMITDTGLLYRAYVYASYQEPDEDGDIISYGMSSEFVCDTGLTFPDYTDMSMLRLDEGLVIASGADLFFVGLGEEPVAGKIGSLEGAMAISALYTDEQVDVNEIQSVKTVYGSSGVEAVSINVAPQLTGNRKGILSVGFSDNSVGGLNSVKTEVSRPEELVPGDPEVTNTLVNVTLSETVDVTNGLITVEYDTGKLTFVSASSAATVMEYRVDTENGVVTIAYAASAAIPAGETLAVLEFTHNNGADTLLDTSVTAKTVQRNNEEIITDEDTDVDVDNRGDKTELQKDYDEASALTEADYTADTWQAVKEAMDAAKAVLDDPDALQPAIDAAEEALEQAMAALIFSVELPTVVGTYTYNGTEQTVVLDGVKDFMTVTGELTATNAGTYTVEFALPEGYAWAEEFDGIVEWTIEKAVPVITLDPNVSSLIYTYGDTVTLPTATSDFGTVTCNYTSDDLVDGGAYLVAYEVKGSDNWEYASVSVTVLIKPKAVAEPTAVGSYTYNGTEQTVTLEGVESFMTVVSGTKATNAGEHEVVVELDANHIWAEGSDGIVEWSIAKKAAHITVIDKQIMIGFAAPDLSDPVVGKDYTVTGLVNGDTVDLVVLTCNPDMYKAGAYAIRVSAEDVNYTFTYTHGKLVVVAGSGEGVGSGDVGYDLPPVDCQCDKFTDVDTKQWYHEAVCFAVNYGIMNGTGNGSTFSPYLQLSRAMMMTMLARLDGVDTTVGATWYEAGVKWAVEKGISDGTNPNANITREQMVTMLYRYAGEPAVSGNLIEGFADADQVSDWAYEAMSWAVTNGIIRGNGEGLNPQGTATRAEVAQILCNYINK